MKFRRQFPIARFIVDFACLEESLVVELDGDYHDYVVEQDQQRQRIIESLGWSVLRFRNDDVQQDVEAVAIAIARAVGKTPLFLKQKGAE